MALKLNVLSRYVRLILIGVINLGVQLKNGESYRKLGAKLQLKFGCVWSFTL